MNNSAYESIRIHANEIRNTYNHILEYNGFHLEITLSPNLTLLKVYDFIYGNRFREKIVSNCFFMNEDIDTVINELVNDLIKLREKDMCDDLKRELDRMALNSHYGIASHYCDATIKNIIFSGLATIVFWTDDTKTVVKCSDEDNYDPYTAVAYAYMKKIFGNNYQFKKMVDKWIPKEKHSDLASAYVDLEALIANIQRNKNAMKLRMPYIARCFNVPDSILKKSDSEEIKKQQIISKEDVDDIRKNIDKPKCKDCNMFRHMIDIKFDGYCSLYNEPISKEKQICTLFINKEEATNDIQS